MLTNRVSGVAPFACKQASHSAFVAHSVGDQLAGECRSPALLHSLASKLPTVASWHTPWETSLLANAGLRRCSIRLQASFPQCLRGTLRGRPACWRMPASGVAPFACKQASHGGLVAQTVGDQLAGECRPPALLHSLASKLPTKASWLKPWETSLLANAGLRCCSIRLQASFPQCLRGTLRGRPACWRMPASGVAPFACKQASHGGLVAHSVGDQLAGECRPPVLLHSLASKLPTEAW